MLCARLLNRILCFNEFLYGIDKKWRYKFLLRYVFGLSIDKNKFSFQFYAKLFLCFLFAKQSKIQIILRSPPADIDDKIRMHWLYLRSAMTKPLQSALLDYFCACTFAVFEHASQRRQIRLFGASFFQALQSPFKRVFSFHIFK